MTNGNKTKTDIDIEALQKLDDHMKIEQLWKEHYGMADRIDNVEHKIQEKKEYKQSVRKQLFYGYLLFNPITIAIILISISTPDNEASQALLGFYTLAWIFYGIYRFGNKFATLVK